MTSASSSTVAASTDAEKPGTAPSGAFVRLSAFDGLFLRSEHLNLMEDYAAALALAVGAASGPGVVHGFEVTLSGHLLSVSPGLAILADGRPVRSTAVLTVAIDQLSPTAGVVYRVGLMWGTWPFGDEPVQGLLCDSGCGGDGASTRTVRQGEGPLVTVKGADDVSTLAAPAGAMRSWVASELFRSEEGRARRWPSTGSTLPIGWQPNPEEALPETLPLALLLPPVDGLDWQVDTWAQRRDRGSPPPARYWEWRLGMRPHDVFIAQVLQFQSQLSDNEELAGRDTAKVALQRRLSRLVDSTRAVQRADPSVGEGDEVGDLVQQVEDLGIDLTEFLGLPMTLSSKGIGSPGAELVELPPAGFVRASAPTSELVRKHVESYLGSPGVVRRVCRCEPGDVGRLFESARHRERTRTPVSTDFDAAHDVGVVDVFVPTRDDGPLFEWVLFTRAEIIKCEEAESVPAKDDVEVFHETEVTGGATLKSLGILSYPASSWTVPEDPNDVFGSIQRVISEAKNEFTLRAQVSTEQRRPLGYLRAALLAGPFGDGEASSTGSVQTSVAGGTETISLVTTTTTASERPRKSAPPRQAAERVVEAVASPAGTASTAKMVDRDAATKTATTRKSTPSTGQR